MCLPAGKSRLASGRAWWLALCLLLCFSGFPAGGTENELPSWPSDTLPLSPTLSGSTSRMETLLTRLAERRTQIASLQTALKELSQQASDSEYSYNELSGALREAVASRDKLQEELTEISSSRARLQEDYVTLRLSLTSYQTEADLQIKELRRAKNWWRLGFFLTAGGASAALIWALAK